jgi:hypothetical protein
MVAVIGAMGLFKNHNAPSTDGLLDPTRMDKSRDFFISRIVPFSGRMVVERMECALPHGTARKEWEHTGVPEVVTDRGRLAEENLAFVRVLMNDAVLDLEFCEGVDEDGLCPLNSFVKSQAYAREDGQGDWERCFQ